MSKIELDDIIYEVKFDSAIVVGYNPSATIKTLTIPPQICGVPVRHIGVKAFQNCEDLEMVFLPKECYSMKQYAFSGCKNLKLIAYTDWLKKNQIIFGEHAFENCESLKTVDAKEGTIWVMEGAFTNCLKLQVVVGEIFVSKENAFINCKELEGLTIANKAQLSAKMFAYTMPKQLMIRGGLSRPSKTLFKKLKNTVIYCTEQFPFLDLIYEGYQIKVGTV